MHVLTVICGTVVHVRPIVVCIVDADSLKIPMRFRTPVCHMKVNRQFVAEFWQKNCTHYPHNLWGYWTELHQIFNKVAESLPCDLFKVA